MGRHLAPGGQEAAGWGLHPGLAGRGREECRARKGGGLGLPSSVWGSESCPTPSSWGRRFRHLRWEVYPCLGRGGHPGGRRAVAQVCPVEGGCELVTALWAARWGVGPWAPGLLLSPDAAQCVQNAAEHSPLMKRRVGLGPLTALGRTRPPHGLSAPGPLPPQSLQLGQGLSFPL